jgi:hypothetical protein
MIPTTQCTLANVSQSRSRTGKVSAGWMRFVARLACPKGSGTSCGTRFATHAAMFGVTPWSLQSCMGHKRIEETMIYVSWANAHRTPIPAEILAVGASELDPDRRVVAMLGVRGAARLMHPKPRADQSIAS